MLVTKHGVEKKTNELPKCNYNGNIQHVVHVAKNIVGCPYDMINVNLVLVF
jgi:hypothetical protein